MPTYSLTPRLGTVAPDFELQGVDDKPYSLASFKEAKVLVVVFMCNHCPYVVATQGRINHLAKDYQSKGVQVVGINSNDDFGYPEDSFVEMKKRAEEQGFSFPYLRDSTQETAKAYGAVCTPEFFVYQPRGGKFLLQYQGRLDDNWKDESAVTRRELAEAVDSLLEGAKPHPDQKPAMGCSIKWK